jgi:hypothetical protein
MLLRLETTRRNLIMRRTSLALTAFFLLASQIPAQESPAKHFDGATWWSYVKVLADLFLKSASAV